MIGLDNVTNIQAKIKRKDTFGLDNIFNATETEFDDFIENEITDIKFSNKDGNEEIWEITNHTLKINNDKYGIYVCCTGLFTQQSYSTNQKKKRFWKKLVKRQNRSM